MPDGIASRFDSTNYTAANERLLDTVLAHPGGALLSRAGVRLGGGLEVSIGGSPEAVTVAPGVGIITDTAGGGSYKVAIPAAVAINFPVRPGVGTSRIDELVAVIKNVDVRPADGTREVDLQLISGAAAASPTAPTIPTGALRIKRLTVPASGTIAQSIPTPRTVAAGGVLPVADQAERDAISPLYDGIVVYREDIDRHEARVAGAWSPVANVTPKTVATDVFTPAAGVDLDDARAVIIPGGLVSVHLKLSGVTYGAGSINVSVGTVKAGMRPGMYFGPLQGWPAGVSGLVEAATGATSLRYAATAATEGVVVLSGTWPLQ